MFRRILIANRGEIAVRVIRACREMGITSIAVYSEADRDSMHTNLADEAICIGPAPARDSYLNIPAIISAAEICDAQAIHPGYGFLSESPKFASICRDCHIGFIGPSPEAIELTGDKSRCREAVKAAGVPIVPGSEGMITEISAAIELANQIGYPVLVKAAAGGGGKGMRIAHNDVALQHAVNVAGNEADAAFGNAGLYLEKFIEDSRHIEVQILGDHHGRIVTLGERECSIQRRHQKLIEETPSVALKDSQRTKLARSAARAAKATGYTNAGTAEFLLAPDGAFYFIEFNARIQVEHPVTEEVTNIDLVTEQIRVAAGEHLGYSAVKPQGCSIEARIYAEDPENNFAPSPGRVDALHLPGGPGIRVDSHLFNGYNVPPFYDSLLAKIISRGTTREQAIDRLVGALAEFRISGIKTTAGLCAKILNSGRFRSGDISTTLIEDFLPKPAA